MKALIVKEQTKRKLTHLTREMSLSGGPPLSDTLDAKHWACYLVLGEEMNALALRVFRDDCDFTAVEIWQQCVELIKQSEG